MVIVIAGLSNADTISCWWENTLTLFQLQSLRSFEHILRAAAVFSGKIIWLRTTYKSPTSYPLLGHTVACDYIPRGG